MQPESDSCGKGLTNQRRGKNLEKFDDIEAEKTTRQSGSQEVRNNQETREGKDEGPRAFFVSKCSDDYNGDEKCIGSVEEQGQRTWQNYNANRVGCWRKRKKNIFKKFRSYERNYNRSNGINDTPSRRWNNNYFGNERKDRNQN